MSETGFFDILLIAWFILALVMFVVLFFIAAPYGRHNRRGWGPSIGNKMGWIIMEAPSPIIFTLLFIIGDNAISVTAVIFLTMWLVHYVHRSFIYPFSLSSTNRMPLFIIGSGIGFNLVNAYLNGRWLFTFSGGYDNRWLTDPRFILGVVLFAGGYFINRRADSSLRRLRRPGESGYGICNQGLYRWVSCPNYLGEIVIWAGWAVATWSLAGLAFALWTLANLAPRAWAHHLWYRQQFPDYPQERKALVPGLW